MNPRSIILGVMIVAISFIGATLAINVLWPRAPASLKEGRPALVAVPPLKPLAGVSTVLAPAAITMAAIGEGLEAQAPRNLAGKRPGAVSPLMPDADIHWTITRGPLNVSGQSDSLVVATPLSGAFQARGTISNAANAVGGAVGNIIGTVAGGVGQQVQNLVGKTFDQRADIRGTVTATARPSIAPNWRLTPNLAAQSNVADVVVPVAGVIKLSVAREVKPFLDNAVREQTTALETRLRNDPFIENAARNEWSKPCRSISLGAAGQGTPNLWLEVRPTHAIAAQPKIDANAVTLFLGVRAETRIVPAETKPDCPFPEQLEIVPEANEGTIDITVPIDIPFTEVIRLVDAQIRNKTFPEDGSSKYATTIKQAEIAPSGDRLLISLLVNVKRHGLFQRRRRCDVARLGTAGAGSGASAPALHQRQARRSIQSGVRAPWRGGAGGRALSAAHAGREGGHRPQAVCGRCQEAYRLGRDQFHASGRWPNSRHQHHHAASHRHRL